MMKYFLYWSEYMGISGLWLFITECELTVGNERQIFWVHSYANSNVTGTFKWSYGTQDIWVSIYYQCPLLSSASSSVIHSICLVTDFKCTTQSNSVDHDFVSICRINIARGSAMVEKLTYTNRHKNPIKKTE